MWTSKRFLRLGTAVFCLAGVLVGVSGGAASAAKAPIIIALISDQTGGTASSYANDQFGAQAYFDAVNAAGGVDGHKIDLVLGDTQGSASGNLTAAQTMVEDKGAYAVIDLSTATFGAATYLQKQGVPVIGAEVDGPEWGQKPNSNMFSVSGTLLTPYNGKTYSYNNGVELFKQLHDNKLAQIVANVPSAISAADSTFAAAKSIGVSQCLDAVTPLGDVNFTTFALQMKSLKCNAVEVLSTVSTCIAVASALKQAGLNKVADVCATGYDQSVLDQPSALAAMQGVLTGTSINVLGNDIDAPTKLFLSRLKKYTAFAGGIPNVNIIYAYESAALVVKGLQLAGPTASRASFISHLRTISSFTGAGLIAAPGDNFTHFGTLASLPKKACGLYYEIKGKSYVPAGKPVCGELVASSS
jgi:branched-chain amino acid transport system substrate-binding protein